MGSIAFHLEGLHPLWNLLLEVHVIWLLLGPIPEETAPSQGPQVLPNKPEALKDLKKKMRKE